MTADRKAANASIRGWFLFVVGAVLFFVGLGIRGNGDENNPLLGLGILAVLAGFALLTYAWLLRRRP